MEAIEAVVELAKERDELANEIEAYEKVFESLVGKDVTMSVKSKRHTRFVQCVVTEFNAGEGWELTNTETDEVYMVDLEDFVNRKFWVNVAGPEAPKVKKNVFCPEHDVEFTQTPNKDRRRDRQVTFDL
jgi:hypothetical protein